MGLFGSRDKDLYRGDAPFSDPGSGGGAPVPRYADAADAHAQRHASDWVGINRTLGGGAPASGVPASGVPASGAPASGDGQADDPDAELWAELDAEIEGKTEDEPDYDPDNDPDIGPRTDPARVEAIVADVAAATRIPLGIRIGGFIALCLVAALGAWLVDVATDDGPAPSPEETVAAYPTLERSAFPQANDEDPIIDYLGAALQVGVYVGALHPRGPWIAQGRFDRPLMSLKVEIARLDTGTEPVTVSAANWRLQTASGDRIVPLTGLHVTPDLDATTLAAGQSTWGYLLFEAPDEHLDLVFGAATGSTEFYAWNFTPRHAGLITARPGERVRADIGTPPFTVTLTDGQRGRGGAADYLPGAGQGPLVTLYVAVDVDDTFDNSDAVLRPEMFAFVPKGATGLAPTPEARGDSLSATTLRRGTRITGSLTFTTDATTGALVLRDEAGNAMIEWPLDIS